MKVRVTKKTNDNDSDDNSNNSIAKRTPIERYAPFGDMAQSFQQQGFYPTSTSGTEFRPQYGLFASVPLNDGKGTNGYVAVDHNGGGKFSLSIKDPNGKVVKNILNNVGAKDVNNYFTNTNSQDQYGNFQQPSPIMQRVNQIAAAQQSLASK
jgi:hypothetical protein